MPDHLTLGKRIFRYGIILAVFLQLGLWTGCMVGPDFATPKVQVPANWTGPSAAPAIQPATLAEQDLARWWTVFDDPNITSLVKRAIQSNLDLMQAEARIRQAWAGRGIAASGMGPTVDATGSFQRSQWPITNDIEGRNSPINQYQVGFDAAWELDIFGGIRRGIEAADADIKATEENRRDVLVSLTAEVVRNYIELRAFQQRIAIARKNLKTQEHSAKLTRLRFEGGFVSGLDVANAEAEVATTASGIPLLESAARKSIYSLSVLIGLEPAALVKELSPFLDIPAAPPSVPVGVPSDLLLRRPDIRRAEAGIHGATARIGVATSALFPRFTILGSAGLQGGDLSSTLNWAGRFWSIGPAVSWPVFEMGRIRSNIELQKALQEQDIIAYRRTVLTALQEVENALIASTKEEEHRKTLARAVTSNEKAVRLATKLYTMGQTDFLNVLSAQRSLYFSEDALVQSGGAVSTYMVALYKALGGGWDQAPAQAVKAVGH